MFHDQRKTGQFISTLVYYLGDYFSAFKNFHAVSYSIYFLLSQQSTPILTTCIFGWYNVCLIDAGRLYFWYDIMVYDIVL